MLLPIPALISRWLLAQPTLRKKHSARVVMTLPSCTEKSYPLLAYGIRGQKTIRFLGHKPPGPLLKRRSKKNQKAGAESITGINVFFLVEVFPPIVERKNCLGFCFCFMKK